ncbi:MAG: hypothetical protein Q8J78_04580 [Moraxellaceae bacterium]|nr:hypothetical protein [Moraxellaceae bacterium]
MSKWMKVLLLSIFFIATSMLTVSQYGIEKKYSLHGRQAVATVDEIRFVEQARPSGQRPRLFDSADDRTEKYRSALAVLSYVNRDGVLVTFEKSLSESERSLLAKQGSHPIEYISFERNSERFPESWPKFLVILGGVSFISLLLLIRVVRTPSEVDDDDDAPTPAFMAWPLRGGLLLMAVGGVSAGVIGVLTSSSPGADDFFVLGAGIACGWAFFKSLSMR